MSLSQKIAIDYLRQQGNMAVLLVEQYFAFARDLYDDYIVLEKGKITLAGDDAVQDEEAILNRMKV